MKKKIDLLASFGIYGIGLLSFLIIEILIIKHYSSTSISNWAFYKSTVMLIGSFTLLGYGQVLLRDPRLIKSHFKNFISRALILSLCSTIIIFFIKEYSWQQALFIFLGIILYGFINYDSASARANNKLWKSQFSKNFWRCLILLFLLANFTEDIFLYFVMAFAITLLLSYIFKGSEIESLSEAHKDISISEAEGLSRAFLITSITLIFAVHGEQFVINLFGDEIASVHLFKYFAVITPIALSLIGFLGFYLGPRIIRNPSSKSLSGYNSLVRKVLFFSFFNTLLSAGVGILFLLYYLDISFKELDFFLIVTLSCVIFIRGIYVTNSVYVGIYANKSELFEIAKYLGLFTFLYLVAVVITLFLFSGIFTAQIISILSLINWLSRYIISDVYAKRMLKRKTVV